MIDFVKKDHFCNSLSLSVCLSPSLCQWCWTETLDHEMMRQVFYLFVTVTGQAGKKHLKWAKTDFASRTFFPFLSITANTRGLTQTRNLRLM
jgi:hypothetical protein